MIKLWMGLICVGLAGVPASLDQRVLIEKALDEPTHITLDNVKIGQAFAMITEQTGVEVVMRPDVMAMIPYGAETTVNAAISGTTLRLGLSELFGRLGMTFVVTDKNVEIIPKEALLCLDRPATWDELDTLAALSAAQPGTDRDALAALRDKLQFQVQAGSAWDVFSATIRETGAGPGDEVLTVACDKLGWAWCISGKAITILSAEQKVRRQLQYPIDLRAGSRPLLEVMQDVGRRVRVKVRVEPGALEAVAPEVRERFTLNSRLLSAEDTLDTIAAAAGLGYLIDAEGVLFYKPAPLGPPYSGAHAPAVTTTQADPVVGMVEWPLGDGRTMTWMVRKSELPPEMFELRSRHLDEAFEILLRP